MRKAALFFNDLYHYSRGHGNTMLLIESISERFKATGKNTTLIVANENHAAYARDQLKRLGVDRPQVVSMLGGWERLRGTELADAVMIDMFAAKLGTDAYEFVFEDNVNLLKRNEELQGEVDALRNQLEMARQRQESIWDLLTNTKGKKRGLLRRVLGLAEKGKKEWRYWAFMAPRKDQAYSVGMTRPKPQPMLRGDFRL